MAKDTVVLLGCGDVGPIHEPMAPYSELARPALEAADIRFAQVERVYSEKGNHQVQAEDGGHSRVKPHMASVFSDCGFDVVSLASNHGMDWGPDALLDSMELFQKKGMQTVGAGRNLKEARQPAIVERNGVRIAILGYCSVLRDGYGAGLNKAGIAPLRARTYYEPMEYQAGVPSKTVTVPYQEDLEGMIEDIASAKKSAHSVVVSLHWGVHFIPRLIADYQPIVAEAAFKAGADLILGHHAHAPKAIEVRSGKVCFYSLSNFIMSAPPRTPEQAAAFARRYGVDMDPEYPHLWYGSDAKRSLIAKSIFSRQGVQEVSFLPVLIDKKLRPEVLRSADQRFSDALKHMEWVSEGFNHKFTVEGDEVVITGT
ncbi:MAG: CapA family protein [Betaproteobacteria bacterium]|nr:CapA family protein [Betaproteobacteria bacterium]